MIDAKTAAQPRNFCPECGKPTPPESIHTCTPPARIAAPSIASLIEKHGSMLAAANEQDRLARTAAPSESAFGYIVRATCRAKTHSTVYRQRVFASAHDQEQCYKQWLAHHADRLTPWQGIWWEVTKHTVYENAATAPLEAQPIPTDLSKRLRAQASTHLVAMIRQDILAAADEIDRYYSGMVAWKKTAEEKDAASTSLWNALDLMVSTFERPIGMYANERKACDIARTALSRTAAPALEAPQSNKEPK